jgi:hypothetical protein
LEKVAPLKKEKNPIMGDKQERNEKSKNREERKRVR